MHCQRPALTIMDCLKDYIGINVCANQTAPVSGIYINSLPGISLEGIDKIATADQITYIGVWNDVQAQAFVRLKNDFINALAECYTINRHCDYEDIICDNKEHLTTALQYLLGNQLMLFRLYTTRLNRFTTVDIKQAEELRDFYQVEYEKALKTSINFIDVSACCQTECSNNPQSVIWLP
jgi:hypothetical protein